MENDFNHDENLNNLDFKSRKEEILNKAYEQEKKSIAGFFIRHFRFTYLILIVIILAGFYSLFSLPKESEPEVRVPYAVINTIYPGATPLDVENQITDKIEEKIDGLENLNRYTSNSGQGFSSIFVEYNAEADLQESFNKLREAVDNAEPNLPDEAESPVVTEINFNDMPIATYSLSGSYSDQELKDFADDLKREFENIKDVNKVEILGGLEREFQVLVDQTRLASFNISLGQIINAVQMNNISLPSGDIEVDGFEYNVRVKGKFTDISQLENVVVATYQNTPVFLHDIALVQDAFKDKDTESKIGFSKQESSNTVSLQLYKRTGGNILNIVDDAQAKIDAMYKNNTLPSDLNILKTNDNSVYIKEDLRTLGGSALQTFVLINLILLFILSFRGALITAISIPLSFLISFLFLYLQGMTLNSMVLFSLVLSLGLMVDNAIVIIEGINEYVTQHKKKILEAAILSVWNFKWAITAGTMTTVAAFLPMLLVSGILGEYMSILPKTITVTLLSSLFVAIVVIPTLAARFIKISSNINDGGYRNKKRHLFIAGIFKKLHEKYIAFHKSVLPDRKKRITAIIISVVLFFSAMAVPIFGFMKIEMFPSIDFDYFVVNIELPVGSSLEKNKIITEEVEKIISQIPELDNYVTNIGTSASLGYGSSSGSGSYLSGVVVNLIKSDKRSRTSYEIAESIRPQLETVQGAIVRAEELEAGPPSGAPIEIRIEGEDLKVLTDLSNEIKEYFENIPGVINIKDSLEDSPGEFVFTIDKQKANFYGLSIASIASNLRNAIYGITATEASLDGDDVDVVVKYDKNKFSNASDLENLLIITPSGENIPLKEVADINFEPALLSINHRDGNRTVSVTANIESGANAQSIMSEFESKKDLFNIPEDVFIKTGGETEEIEKSFRETFLSLIVAVILIAMILVLQFNSFSQPFIILFSLPLALIGVIFGLAITGQAFGLPAFIGIVSLAGIVVNDAIVLIDRINKNIDQGMEFYEAIIEGGTARMQPIFLTSITTIVGIFPLIYANELWRGLSLTVIFGLICSTVLILIMVPIFYVSICKNKKW